MSSESSTNLRTKTAAQEDSACTEQSDKSCCSTKSTCTSTKNCVMSFFDKSLCGKAKKIKKFIKESKTPKKAEFRELLRGHIVGLVLIGLFAYVIKVIHIPINNMIVGSSK